MSILDLLDPEEFVGRRWHALVGEAWSYPRHADAAVRLEDVQAMLGVFFRGLGGDPGVQLGAGAGAESEHRLTWRQKLGMAAEKMERATLDGESLLLPPVIDLFPEKALNRDLYLWLGAWFAFAEGGEARPEDAHAADLWRLEMAERTTHAVIAAAPGLGKVYGRLAEALLELRPVRKLPSVEQAVEERVLALLSGARVPPHLPTPPLGEREGPAAAGGGRVRGTPGLSGKYRPFLPVPLWGEVVSRPPEDRRPDEDEETGTAAEPGDALRRKASRKTLDQAERDDGLILNNMEKILGLAEMLNVNRAVDDDDEEEAKKAADDLDEITLSKHKKRAAAKLKLDLDLPPDAVDETRLSGKHLYPEWDHRKNRYLPDHCAVLAGVASEEGEAWEPDAEAARRIRRVRRQFEALRPRRVTLHAQPDGSELDMDALVRARCDLRASGRSSDGIYLNAREQARDLSVALLVDVSLSTDAWIEGRRVLDVEKEAVSTLAMGIEACGDENAIYTFTSRRRDFVRVETVKGFDESFGPAARRRVAALKPGYYTRIGAALRHVTRELVDRPHRHRLLLVLTDGKPNDVDHYEGRFGIEDSRVAVQEARRAGLAVFGVTVDREARDYFPRIFGRGSYHIVGHATRLAAALPKIYRQLVN